MNQYKWIMDAWFIEVYGKVVATYRTKEAAQAAIANGAWSGYHPYLTHGPAKVDDCR